MGIAGTARLCQTNCRGRDISKNVFRKSAPGFFHRPKATRSPADAGAGVGVGVGVGTVIVEQMAHCAQLCPALPMREDVALYDQHVLTTDCTKALISPSRFWSIS